MSIFLFYKIRGCVGDMFVIYGCLTDREVPNRLCGKSFGRPLFLQVHYIVLTCQILLADQLLHPSVCFFQGFTLPSDFRKIEALKENAGKEVWSKKYLYHESLTH
jgi:hypothetical protein